MPDFDKQAVEKAEACLAEEDYNGAKEALSEIEGEDAEKLLNYINAAVNFDVGIPYAAFKELGDYKDAKLYTEYYKCFYELDESKIADAVKSPLHTQKRASRIFEHCKYSSRTTFAEALKILAFRNTYIELTGEEALSSHDRSITQDTELTMSELVSALPPSDGGKVVIIKINNRL